MFLLEYIVLRKIPFIYRGTFTPSHCTPSLPYGSLSFSYFFYTSVFSSIYSFYIPEVKNFLTRGLDIRKTDWEKDGSKIYSLQPYVLTFVVELEYKLLDGVDIEPGTLVTLKEVKKISHSNPKDQRLGSKDNKVVWVTQRG